MATISGRMQMRGDTAANWSSVNPTLLAKEWGLETDTGKLKFGTGASRWNDLDYFSPILDGSGHNVIDVDNLQELADAVDELAADVAYKTLTLQTQTGTSYTLVLADAGAKVTMNNAASNTLTIPTNASVAFPVGTIIGVTMLGAGTTTIQASGSVNLNGSASGAVTIDAQYTGATLTKLASDTWIAEGNVTAVEA